VHIQHRDKVQLTREANDSPDQAPIGSVRRHRAVLVGANQRIRDGAEELVVVVEITPRTRVDIARV